MAGPATSLLIGLLFFERGPDHRLISALPPMIHVRASDALATPWLKEVTTALEREVAGGGPGTVSILSNLSQALFGHAVRTYVAGLPRSGDGKWFAALMDEEIGPALAVIHQRPGEPWSVQSLADHVAMSRSTFAERFNNVVGEPPMQYLVAYRMNKAEQMLRDGGMAVKDVAARVGYGSLAAFSNAFKRERGVSPGSLRR
jgi:AraC-like DNA-binding protein